MDDNDTSLTPVRNAFNDKLNDAKIVGLGEATHGDKTTFAFNFNMVKYLVGERQFRILIVEAPNSIVRPLDDFIQSDATYITGQIDTLVYKTLPAGAWRDLQFASLIKWLKDYNLEHKTKKVALRGMSIDAVPKEDILNTDIKPYDPSGAATIEQKWKSPGYNKYDEWNDIFNWQDAHARLIAGLPDALRQRILADFKDTKSAIEFYSDISIIRINKDDMVIEVNGKPVTINKDNFFWKLHSNPDYRRRDTLNRFTRLYNKRDSIMAVNSLRETGNEKAIVWAHNDHIINPGERMMGDYLKRALGKKYFNIITEYSKAGTIVIFDPLQGFQKSPDPMAGNTTIKELKRRYGATEGIVFSSDLTNQGYRLAKFPDAGREGRFGMSVIPVNSFNAFVILGQLYPRDAIEQK